MSCLKAGLVLGSLCEGPLDDNGILGRCPILREVWHRQREHIEDACAVYSMLSDTDKLVILDKAIIDLVLDEERGFYDVGMLLPDSQIETFRCLFEVRASRMKFPELAAAG